MNDSPLRTPPADYVSRVENACAQLATDSKPITADAVATLTGLAVQIDQLRDSLDAVARNVRRHEEQLRRLNKQQRSN